MKKLLTSTLLFLLFFTLTACQSRLDVNNAIREASGKTYILTAPYKDHGITVNINGDSIYGFAGVNNYKGIINVKDNNIIISNISRTRMAGQTDTMKIEEDFIKNLEASSKITLYKNELRIGNMKFIEK